MLIWLIGAGVVLWIGISIVVHHYEQRKERTEGPKKAEVPAGARWIFDERMSVWNEWAEEVRQAEDSLAEIDGELDDLYRDAEYAEEHRQARIREAKADIAALEKQDGGAEDLEKAREALDWENADRLKEINAAREKTEDKKQELDWARARLAKVKSQEPPKPVIERAIREYEAEVAAEEAAEAALYRGGAPPQYTPLGTTNIDAHDVRRQLAGDIGEGVWKGVTHVGGAVAVALCLAIPLIIYITATGVSFGRVILLTYAATNLASFFLMAIDKSLAKAGQRRIRESTLHVCEALGGFAGSFLAQHIFRHKISKPTYQAAYWTIVLIHLVFWLWWFWIGEHWAQSNRVNRPGRPTSSATLRRFDDDHGKGRRRCSRVVVRCSFELRYADLDQSLVRGSSSSGRTDPSGLSCRLS